MDIKDAVENSVNIKKYWDDKIPLELIEEILDSGRYATCSGNSVTWKVVVVTDDEVKQKIGTCCMKQHWIDKAPVVLVVCSDSSNLKKLYGKKGEDVYSVQTASAAAENMRVTATSLGISSCWVNFFDEKSLKRILNIPKHVKPEVVLTLGYSDFREREKGGMSSLDKIVYFNEWGDDLLPEGEWQSETVLGSIKEDIQSGIRKIKYLFKEKKK